MPITVVTWNVKHFKRRVNAPADQNRVDRVVALPNAQQPDVFALFEVSGSEVFSTIVREMPGYSISITEGAQTQETLVASRHDLHTFTTQRLEFKSGARSLRPGALLTVIDGDRIYPLLFLHLKSFPDPAGYGIRTDQLEKAFAFRNTLAESTQALDFEDARYVFAGDFNTMGMNLTFSDGDIDESDEIVRLDDAATARGMTLAPKTENVTWHAPRSATTSDLDHVVHGNNVTLVTAVGHAEPVQVVGWPQEAGEPAQRAWVRDFSDHALLRFTIDTT